MLYSKQYKTQLMVQYNTVTLLGQGGLGLRAVAGLLVFTGSGSLVKLNRPGAGRACSGSGPPNCRLLPMLARVRTCCNPCSCSGECWGTLWGRAGVSRS